jgi:Uncharacterized protein involved in exopolysaccharide biosynthesis
MAQYELDLQDYLRIFKRRKWVIILTSVFVISSVLVFTNIQTLVYQASATVKVEPSLAIPGVATEFGGDLAALKTEVKIIKSALVAERTARKLGLISDALDQGMKETVIGQIQQKIGAERLGGNEPYRHNRDLFRRRRNRPPRQRRRRSLYRDGG